MVENFGLSTAELFDCLNRCHLTQKLIIQLKVIIGGVEVSHTIISDARLRQHTDVQQRPRHLAYSILKKRLFLCLSFVLDRIL